MAQISQHPLLKKNSEVNEILERKAEFVLKMFCWFC